MRNEISPRQGPIRLREFTIMEMELFFDPEEDKCKYLSTVENATLPLLLAKTRERHGSEVAMVPVANATKSGVIATEWSAYFMALSMKFVNSLGIPIDKQRFEEKLPAERSHYSSQTFDHQIWLDRWGWVEIAGHAYRTDFDLAAHIKYSGVDLSVFKPYATPVEKKTTAIVPIESTLGPLLREKAKTVLGRLVSSDVGDVKRAFERDGYYEVEGFKIQPSHVRFDERDVRETGRRFVPYVVEPSFGVGEDSILDFGVFVRACKGPSGSEAASGSRPHSNHGVPTHGEGRATGDCSRDTELPRRRGFRGRL